VTSTGEVSKLPGDWVEPSCMAADGVGNIYVADGLSQYMTESLAGSFTQIKIGPTIGGIDGAFPRNLTVDASGTLYYYDDFAEGVFYVPPPPGLQPAPITLSGSPDFLPLYTLTGYIFELAHLPFSPIGATSMVAAPNGKMYVVQGSDLFLINRTQGGIPRELFNPQFFPRGGSPQPLYVYNVGNQDAIFTDPTKVFTESGNGVGSFAFGQQSCQPSGVLIPGNYCSIGVSNGAGTGPTVTDTLQFLTNALNNNSAVFKVSGVANPAPQ
jgi:hypothetical protein